jgi:hypothetical protein
MLGEEPWWIPNLAVYKADGAPSFPRVLSGWVCGRILEKVWRLFQATPDSKWEMEPELAFGMICKSGI